VMTFDSDAAQSKRFSYYGVDDRQLGLAISRELAKLLGGKRSGTRPANPLAATAVHETTLQQSAAPVVSRLADHPKLRAVARRFAVQMPERMSAIEKAWSERDFATLAGLAHWLKGSGGTAGFDAFTSPARNLEQLVKARDEQRIDPVIAELRGIVDRIVLPAEETSSLEKVS